MALAMKNSFKAFDRLKESGIPAKQARVIIETLEEATDFNFKDLATKTDLKTLELTTKAELTAVRSETKEEFTNMRAEMKEEFVNVRAEMKEEFVNVRSEMKVMQGDIAWLKRLFMGTILLILANIAINLLHL